MEQAMRMLFMGRKQVGSQCLQWAHEFGFDVVGVLTDSHLSGSPTAATAKRLNIPVMTLEQVQSRISSNEIEFEIGVSVVYWRIIRHPLLNFPGLGIINFHPAPLPEYKGTAGYNLAILNSLDQWSVTAHYVDQNIDTGGIIDSFDFSIDPVEETAQSLERASMAFMFSLFKKTMRRAFQEGKLAAKENHGGEYTSRREMENLKQLKETDDWDRKIRAFWFPPYTGAYIERHGRRYTVVNDWILKRLQPPGQTSLHDS